MQKLQIFARLVDDNDKPVAGQIVTLQVFEVSRGQWRSLANVRTGRGGEVERVQNLASEGAAPMLRLIEGGDPAVRVLAFGGLVRFDRNTQVLFVDFGTIERLDEQAFAVGSGESQLAGERHTIAGAPNRPNFSNTLAMRMVLARHAAAPAATGAAAVAAAATPSAATATAAAPQEAEQIKVLNAHIATFGLREVALNREIEVKSDAIRLSQKRIEALEAERDEEKRKRVETEEREAALKAQVGKQVRVDALASNFGAQVKSAQDTMRRAATPYRLGRVQINLKALVGDEGRSLTLPDAADLTRPDAGKTLADVSIELSPESEAAPEALAGTVPDVLGLTESAARRVLQAVGLRMESAYTSVGAGAATLGQAVKQSPAKGKPHEKGQPVLVVFARE